MKYNLRPLIKYNLSKNRIKKFKLVNPDYLRIISRSDFYNSSFDNPLITGLNLDELNYRCTSNQKEQWIERIINNNPNILKISEKRGFIVLTVRNELIYNNGSRAGIKRYITFYDRNFNLEGEVYGSKKETPSENKKKEKNGIHNVQNRSKVKRKGIGKGRRK